MDQSACLQASKELDDLTGDKRVKKVPLPVLLPERLFYVLNRLKPGEFDLLELVYDDDLIFINPFGEIYGINALKEYFSKRYKNTFGINYSLAVIAAEDQEDQAFIEWQMNLQHKKIRSGVEIIVSGVSKIEYHDKITYHRDYFDPGEMLYDHLPFISSCTRWLKKVIS